MPYELPDLVSDLELNFDYGNYITEKVPVIDPFDLYPEQRKTDNIVAPTRLGLLVNNKLKTVFEKLNIRNIQYFKARLIEQSSQTIDESYCIANIVDKFYCIDIDKSKVEFFSDGDIEFIEKLVLVWFNKSSSTIVGWDEFCESQHEFAKSVRIHFVQPARPVRNLRLEKLINR